MLSFRLSAAPGEGAQAVAHTCEVHLSARHAAERMSRCWGSGAGLIFDETRDSIK